MCEAANTKETSTMLKTGLRKRETSVWSHPRKKVSSIIAAAIPEARSDTVSLGGKKCGTCAPGQWIATGVNGISVRTIRRTDSRSARGEAIQRRP
jgi:hypothetical protein